MIYTQEDVLYRNTKTWLSIAIFPIDMLSFAIFSLGRMWYDKDTLIRDYVNNKYRQTSNIRGLVCNILVDHSYVIGASSVGAAPTTFLVFT